MKKTVISLMILVISLNATSQNFIKGTSVVNLGVGLGGNVLNYSGANSQLAYSISAEKGIWPVGEIGIISMGGYAGRSGYKYSGKYGTYTYSQKWNYTTIGVRSAFHLTALKDTKIDLYGGLMLGHNILTYKYEDNDPYGDYTSAGTYGGTTGTTEFLGCRYYINKKSAAFAELGYGVSYLTAGVSIKLQ